MFGCTTLNHVTILIVSSDRQLCMATESSCADHTIYTTNFTDGTLSDEIADLYADLVSEHGLESVLVLKRFDTGLAQIRSRLQRSVDSTARPVVKTLVQHAHQTIDGGPNPPKRLSSYERSYLFDLFLDQYTWDDNYLQKASAHDSFARDAEQFSIVATWQGVPVTRDPVLDGLISAHTAFTQELDDLNYLEHARVIHKAKQVCEPTATLSAVVVLETEDFTTAERDYVQSVFDAPIHWVISQLSSVQRIRNETGNLSKNDFGKDTELVTYPDENVENLLDNISHFLASGAKIDNASGGTSAVVFQSQTFDDQIQEISREIERLRTKEGLRYDDIAVVLKDSRSPIRGVIKTLNDVGIPTSSTTVSGLSDDPSVRELYTVIRLLSEIDDSHENDRRILNSRVGSEITFDHIKSKESIVEGLWMWISDTNLKRRIAESESEIEARSQFRHVIDIIEMASFVENHPSLNNTWDQLLDLLEFSFEHSAPDDYDDNIDSVEGGVLVDSVQRIKTGNWNTVFIANCTDQEFPSEPRINRLFPRSHLDKIPEYPMVSAPTKAEVESTFPTADDISTQPFRAYYNHYSRRLLAVAARAATDRLYFTTYREHSSDPGKYRRPSRFLLELMEQFPNIEKKENREIRTEDQAIDRTLNSIDKALSEVRRAPTTEIPLQIDSIESEFGAIQYLLENSSRGDKIGAAVEARIDLAEGVVRRE